jgi:hypothetical protein
MRTRSLIRNMVFGGFPKKIRDKTFYFHSNKKVSHNPFLLSFGHRVHFRSQTLTFWSNTPEYKFQSKTVKISHFTLEKSIFFVSYQCFFHSYQSCPMLRGVTKKNKKNGRLLGTWYLEDFQKKLGTKLFIFTVNFFFTLILFYLVLALESISGVKSRLLCQTTLNINFSQKLSNYHISLWRNIYFLNGGLRKVVVTFFQYVKFIFLTTHERTFQLSLRGVEKLVSKWSEK